METELKEKPAAESRRSDAEGAAEVAREIAEEKTRQKRRRGNTVRTIFIIIFAAVFLVSAFKILQTLKGAKDETAAMDELADIVAEIEKQTEDQAGENSSEIIHGSETPEYTGDDYSADAMLPQYKALYDMNKDFFAWIKIDDTVVNYPVMYTPKNPEYYLRKAFNKEYALSGTPFIDAKCQLGKKHYFVYGHNMHTGIMFHSIVEYENADYWKAHPVIHFDTLYEKGDYEVVAAFRSQIFAEDDKVFKYYDHMDLTDEKEFNEYISNVLKLSSIDTGIIPEFGDTILTLSTCAYHTENGRFAVVARKIKTNSSKMDE